MATPPPTLKKRPKASKKEEKTIETIITDIRLGENEKGLCLDCVLVPCVCDLLKLEMKLEILKKRRAEEGGIGGTSTQIKTPNLSTNTPLHKTCPPTVISNEKNSKDKLIKDYLTKKYQSKS